MSKQATTKEPFLPFFVGDFMAATSEWEGEAVSLYATLLLHQWAKGSIPADPRSVCKLVRWDWEVFSLHWRVVKRKFAIVQIEEDEEPVDRLVNNRLEIHRAKTRELSIKNSRSGQLGARTRWGGDDDHGPRKPPKKRQGNGERHPEAKRTPSESIANATENDGERHEKAWPRANGESDASANSVTHSNPSHPIPSHPIHSDSSYHLEIVSAARRLNGAIAHHPNATTQGVLAVELRALKVRTSSLDPILAAWVAEKIPFDRIIEALDRARHSLGEDAEVGSKYLDRVLRSPPRPQNKSADALKAWDLVLSGAPLEAESRAYRASRTLGGQKAIRMLNTETQLPMARRKFIEAFNELTEHARPVKPAGDAQGSSESRSIDPEAIAAIARRL